MKYVEIPLQYLYDSRVNDTFAQQVLDAVPPEFRDLAFNSTDIIDVNQEIPSTDEWALRNLDYVSKHCLGSASRSGGSPLFSILLSPFSKRCVDCGGRK